MTTASETRQEGALRSTPVMIGVCVLLAIVGFFLWEEHRAHVLGILPYLLLAACPIVHLFMHGGHGGHHAAHKHPARDKEDGDRS